MSDDDIHGLCEECARLEIRKATACRVRQKAAEAAGQSFVCTCEDTICTHRGSEQTSNPTETK